MKKSKLLGWVYIKFTLHAFAQLCKGYFCKALSSVAECLLEYALQVVQKLNPRITLMKNRIPNKNGRRTAPPLPNMITRDMSKQHYTKSTLRGWRERQKMFFCAIMAVFKPAKPCTTPLLSADGTTHLKEKNSINERWTEHFNTLLSRPSTSTVNSWDLDRIPQKPFVGWMPWNPPTPPPQPYKGRDTESNRADQLWKNP